MQASTPRMTIVGTSGIPVVESRRAARQGMSDMGAYGSGRQQRQAYVIQRELVRLEICRRGSNEGCRAYWTERPDWPAGASEAPPPDMPIIEPAVPLSHFWRNQKELNAVTVAKYPR